MRPSLQLIATAKITEHNRNGKTLGPFHKEQDSPETPAGIRALHIRWKQVKKNSEMKPVRLRNDIRPELFPCGCGNARDTFPRINNVLTTDNPLAESLQS